MLVWDSCFSFFETLKIKYLLFRFTQANLWNNLFKEGLKEGKKNKVLQNKQKQDQSLSMHPNRSATEIYELFGIWNCPGERKKPTRLSSVLAKRKAPDGIKAVSRVTFFFSYIILADD